MKLKVAVFPAGTEIGLEINNALKQEKLIELYGLTSISDHSKMVYENIIHGVPFIGEDRFLETLNEILESYGIDFIYPAHDDVLLYLTTKSKEVKAKVITSGLMTVEITRSKCRTYDFFAGESFIPRVFGSIDVIEEYPVFIKPDIGQGSRGARKISGRTELEMALKESVTYALTEWLPGNEYTVDCFTDTIGQLLICKMRTRDRIRNGIAVKSRVVTMENEIKNIAEVINSRLKFNGAWFFQVKEDRSGTLKLLEIAARIAGTMGLTRNLGINYPMLTLYNHLNIPVTISENDYEIEVDRALISRYNIGLDYDTVYIDFDDTLILKGKVNVFLLALLYQLAGNDKKIILLTRYTGDIAAHLQKYKLCPYLFEKIIQLNSKDMKCNIIKDIKSIFIDASYMERKLVKEALSIPVFGLDNVESLLSWR